MIAVIFEVEPRAGEEPRYLEHAARLGPMLQDVDGFISIERFRSFQAPHKILSLSFWRDEQSVAAWRNHQHHRDTQGDGRDTIFDDYRLRVAEVLRDYGLRDRAQAPSDSKAVHG